MGKKMCGLEQELSRFRKEWHDYKVMTPGSISASSGSQAALSCFLAKLKTYTHKVEWKFDDNALSKYPAWLAFARSFKYLKKGISLFHLYARKHFTL